jgi:hypothetical protein
VLLETPVNDALSVSSLSGNSSAPVRTASIDPCRAPPPLWPAMFRESPTPMGLIANNKAEMDFKELLSAAWAAQSAQLHG